VLEDGAKLELPAGGKPPKRGSEITKADGSIGKVKVVATPDRRRKIMNLVCLECHSKGFTEGFMTQFDNVVELYNAKFGVPAEAIMAGLYEQGLLTPLPFDEPLEFTYWELWHDEGARARHGASMASPNHAWWEGMYLVGRNFYSRFLPEARAVAGERAPELVDAQLADGGRHAWLSQPQATNPILGYVPPPEPEPEPEPATELESEPAAVPDTVVDPNAPGGSADAQSGRVDQTIPQPVAVTAPVAATAQGAAGE